MQLCIGHDSDVEKLNPTLPEMLQAAGETLISLGKKGRYEGTRRQSFQVVQDR